MTEKIILDTDIGGDVDDAVCLAYLLAQPACVLLGIVTVTGEGEKRARLASVLTGRAGKGRDIPIYVGAEQPLLTPQIQPKAEQAECLPRWEHDTDFPGIFEAIDYMRKTICENPGEVTLLTIGGLTNTALLFAIDPEIPGLLKELVMMNGYFMQPGEEWNIRLDPYAAALVFRASPPQTRCIGIDVTSQVRMDAAEVRTRFQEIPALHPVLDFAEVWFRNQDKILFHDPLAAAVIFEPDICTFQNGLAEIDPIQQATNWNPGHPSARHQVAVTVKPDRFFEHYFSVFSD